MSERTLGAAELFALRTDIFDRFEALCAEADGDGMSFPEQAAFWIGVSAVTSGLTSLGIRPSLFASGTLNRLTGLGIFDPMQLRAAIEEGVA